MFHHKIFIFYFFLLSLFFCEKLHSDKKNIILSWVNSEGGKNGTLMMFNFQEKKTKEISSLSLNGYKLNHYNIHIPLVSVENASNLPVSIYSWKKNGKELSFITKENKYKVVLLNPFSNERKILYESENLLYQPVFSPSGDLLVFIEREKENYKFILIDNSMIKPLLSLNEITGLIEWHRDGEYFLYYKKTKSGKISTGIFSIKEKNMVEEIKDVISVLWLWKKKGVLVFFTNGEMKEILLDNLKFTPSSFKISIKEKSQDLVKIANLMGIEKEDYPYCKVSYPLKLTYDDKILFNYCAGGYGGIKFEAREIYKHSEGSEKGEIFQRDGRDFSISYDNQWVLIAGYRNQGCMNILMKRLNDKSKIVWIQNKCPKKGIACIQPSFRPTL